MFLRCCLSSDRETPRMSHFGKKTTNVHLCRVTAKRRSTCICRFIRLLIRILNKIKHTEENMISLAVIKRCWLPLSPVFVCSWFQAPWWSYCRTALRGTGMSAHVTNAILYSLNHSCREWGLVPLYQQRSEGRLNVLSPAAQSWGMLFIIIVFGKTSFTLIDGIKPWLQINTSILILSSIFLSIPIWYQSWGFVKAFLILFCHLVNKSCKYSRLLLQTAEADSWNTFHIQWRRKQKA